MRVALTLFVVAVVATVLHLVFRARRPRERGLRELLDLRRLGRRS